MESYVLKHSDPLVRNVLQVFCPRSAYFNFRAQIFFVSSCKNGRDKMVSPGAKTSLPSSSAANCHLYGHAIQRHDELNTGDLLGNQPRVVRNEKIDSFR